MPINGKDSDDLYRCMNENWRLEEGRYVVVVEDVNLVTVADGRRPLCWELLLNDPPRIVKKYHWIDREGGVHLLINELQGLGMNITRENATTLCNSLIGSKIEIDLSYNGDYQNIIFLKKINK